MRSDLKIDVQILEFASKKIGSIKHPVRAQIIEMLEKNEQMSVTQIMESLKIRQADTSIHLLKMLKYGILKKVRVGKKSIYSLNKDNIELIIRTAEEINKK